MIWKYSLMLVCVLLLTSCTNVNRMCLDVPDLEVQQKGDNTWSFSGLNIGFRFNQDCRQVQYDNSTIEDPATTVSQNDTVIVVADAQNYYEAENIEVYVVNDTEENTTNTSTGGRLWGEN